MAFEPFQQKESVFLWINVVIVILLVGRSAGGILPQVGLNGLSNDLDTRNEETLGSIGNPIETQITGLEAAGVDNGLEAPAITFRQPRGVLQNYKRYTDDVKHVNSIPTVNHHGRKRGTPPPPDDNSDEDDFETLEANREAFLEILNDHAKHPHRRRSYKRHSNKFQLKYDFDAHRYTIVEEISDEF